MCGIIFEKAKGVYGEAAVQMVLKEGVTRNFAEFTKKYLCRNLFF